MTAEQYDTAIRLKGGPCVVSKALEVNLSTLHRRRKGLTKVTKEAAIAIQSLPTIINLTPRKPSWAPD